MNYGKNTKEQKPPKPSPSATSGGTAYGSRRLHATRRGKCNRRKRFVFSKQVPHPLSAKDGRKMHEDLPKACRKRTEGRRETGRSGTNEVPGTRPMTVKTGRGYKYPLLRCSTKKEKDGSLENTKEPKTSNPSPSAASGRSAYGSHRWNATRRGECNRRKKFVI